MLVLFYNLFYLFVCLFVCFGYFVPLENCSVIWRRHQWRTANFDRCSALMAIEHWGFFSVPHLLWHGASVYNGHLRGPVKFTPIAERLSWNSHYLFLRLRSVAVEISTPNLPLPLAGRMLYPTAPPPRSSVSLKLHIHVCKLRKWCKCIWCNVQLYVKMYFSDFCVRTVTRIWQV